MQTCRFSRVCQWFIRRRKRVLSFKKVHHNPTGGISGCPSVKPIPLAHDVYTSLIARRSASSRNVNKDGPLADPALLKLEVPYQPAAPAMFSAAPGAPQPGRGDLNVLHPERGGSPDLVTVSLYRQG